MALRQRAAQVSREPEGRGNKAARQPDIAGEHDHQDPDDVRPAHDRKIEPVADAVVAPVAPQRNGYGKQRNGEHVGGKLQHPAPRDAGLRQGQGVDLPGDVNMKDAPDDEKDRSQTCIERRQHAIAYSFGQAQFKVGFCMFAIQGLARRKASRVNIWLFCLFVSTALKWQ
jgi:hypothetical protein